MHLWLYAMHWDDTYVHSAAARQHPVAPSSPSVRARTLSEEGEVWLAAGDSMSISPAHARQSRTQSKRTCFQTPLSGCRPRPNPRSEKETSG